MGLQTFQIDKGKAAAASGSSSNSARNLLNSVEAVFTGNKPPLMASTNTMKRQSSLVRQLSRLLRPSTGPMSSKLPTIASRSSLRTGLGGLPWRTEALEEALLHLDSWSGWFHRNNGREVVRTLIAEASPTELNHMIANSDMERFWRLVNTDVRETLQPRLPELRPSACEAMISGLQKLGIFQRNLGLRGWWVDWVRDIVLNMRGQDLTALKNAMDDGGDAHNIHKLIYNDILDHNVREELLVHIAKEATAVRDAGWRALKVVSDIDDTFLCSGGSFPSGVDKRFPKGTIYPGVIALYRALTEARHYRRMHRIQSQRMFGNASANGSPGPADTESVVSAQDSVQVDQVTVCAVDPSSDQLTSIQIPADASLTDAAQLLGNALTEDDSSVQQYWVNLDPESQDDVIPRLPHGDPIFEINLVLLSARPGGKRGGGLLTRLIYARFQELVHSGHMHALPTLLPGQWHAGLKAVKSILRRIFIKRDRAWKSYTKAWAPVGMHKYHSFMEYVQLYPEYDFIFLGDNGQGDAMCADRVIEKADANGLMLSKKDSSSYSATPLAGTCSPVFHGALIHTVQDQKHTLRAVESEDATETEALLSAAEQGQAGTGKFFYFSTFVQAALIVHELHLLDIASLRQVALEAQEDFYRLMARGKLGQTGFRTWLRTSAYTIQQALNRDVAEVNELLPEQDRLELLDMVQSNMTRQNKREV